MAKSKKQRNAEYWEKNKERLLAAKRDAYKKDKKRFQDANKRWLDKNRDHWNAYQREYRRRKKAELDKSNKA